MPLVVPLGQYLPGDSFVHRLDARSKLIAVLAVTIALFGSSGWAGLVSCVIAVTVAFASSGIPPRLAFRGLRPIAVLLVFTVLVNSFGVSTAAGQGGAFGFQPDGLLRGLYFSSRIVALIAATSLVTFTTSPVDMADGLVSFMRPLRAVRFPVDDVAMMFSIAMRFIPTTAEEAEKIVVAQTARGARFDVGGPIRRAKAWLPVMMPLFVNLFRRADALALAMESRCYTGQGRSSLRERRMDLTDWITVAGSMSLSIGIAVLL